MGVLNNPIKTSFQRKNNISIEVLEICKNRQQKKGKSENSQAFLYCLFFQSFSR